MKLILVIEDDAILNEGICHNLRAEGYQSLSAKTLAQAKELLAKTAIDLAILDVHLPDGDGFTFCNEVIRPRRIPVVFLTSSDMETDVLHGYELGAEDYITKPFSIAVFRKKIQVILQRLNNTSNADLHDFGDLVLNFDTAQAERGNTVVPLTATEVKLLKLLVKNPGTVLTRQLLLRNMWDEAGIFVDDHALTVHVNRLRAKLDASGKEHIKTIYGMGYLWNP
jgi:two-component system, OmpR family, response regulator